MAIVYDMVTFDIDSERHERVTMCRSCQARLHEDSAQNAARGCHGERRATRCDHKDRLEDVSAVSREGGDGERRQNPHNSRYEERMKRAYSAEEVRDSRTST